MVTIEFDRLTTFPGARILDIGCGTGRHVCAAYSLPDIFVVGADTQIKDLQESQQKLNFHDACNAHGGGIWCLAGADIRNLPFRDASFDIVICSEVLEHIEPPHTAMDEIVRILKPGGELAVSVPRWFPEKICWMLWEGYWKVPGGHVRIFRRQEIETLLDRSGVRRTGVHHAHSLHVPYWWMKCIADHWGIGTAAAKAYHRFLEWDIFNKPAFTRRLEHLLNPIIVKSLVLYAKKRL